MKPVNPYIYINKQIKRPKKIAMLQKATKTHKTELYGVELTMEQNKDFKSFLKCKSTPDIATLTEEQIKALLDDFLKMNFHNWAIQDYRDFRIGLSTRSVFRISKNKFEINDFSSGWMQAFVSMHTLSQIISGKISLLEIDFK